MTLTHRLAHPTFSFLRLLLSLVLLCSALAWSPRANASGNGLWMAGNDYFVLMQDVNNGIVVALQVPQTYSPLTVWVGLATSTGISVRSVANENDTLTANYSSNTNLSGTSVINGVSQPFNANLLYAYVGSTYDGVWQKTAANSAFLVYLTLSLSGGILPIQFDVTINPDKTYTYNLFTGSYNPSTYTFTGISLLTPTLGSRLVFNGSNLAGTYITTGQPPSTTSFSANQLIKLAN
ncbi:hypothetical protein [Chitinimonas lacunae]|uniref:Uncharacterized protein n=1 Tax=Chitinimonas lacunae TaxID=1963018 RepID=A0ABV8MPK9_9NEIS